MTEAGVDFLIRLFELLAREPPSAVGGDAGNLEGARPMSDDHDRQRSEADAELEREIRKGRKFTLADAIGRLAGPGAMKGESPVARMQQAEIEIGSWLRCHLADSGGTLEIVLHRRV